MDPGIVKSVTCGATSECGVNAMGLNGEFDDQSCWLMQSREGQLPGNTDLFFNISLEPVLRRSMWGGLGEFSRNGEEIGKTRRDDISGRACVRARVCVCTCVSVRVCVCARVCACVRVHVCECTRVYVYTCVHMCMHVCTCGHVSVHVCVCACMHDKAVMKWTKRQPRTQLS